MTTNPISRRSFISISAAAESVGAIEYYLVEQEVSRFPELDTAQGCLPSFRAMHLAKIGERNGW
jgi:hypothetical protein